MPPSCEHCAFGLDPLQGSYRKTRDVGMLCGEAGVFAIGALLAAVAGHDVEPFVSLLAAQTANCDVDELLYGRSGLLHAQILVWQVSHFASAGHFADFRVRPIPRQPWLPRNIGPWLKDPTAPTGGLGGSIELPPRSASGWVTKPNQTKWVQILPEGNPHKATLASSIDAVFHQLIGTGGEGAGGKPLTWTFAPGIKAGKANNYLGAAHGDAGILLPLLQAKHALQAGVWRGNERLLRR